VSGSPDEVKLGCRATAGRDSFWLELGTGLHNIPTSQTLSTWSKLAPDLSKLTSVVNKLTSEPGKLTSDLSELSSDLGTRASELTKLAYDRSAPA